MDVTDRSSVGKKSSVSELDLLKKKEKQIKKEFLFQTRQLVDTLCGLQFKFDTITEKKNQVLARMEQDLAPKQQKRAEESSHRVFSVMTGGRSWKDGLLFTVLAENDVWAKKLVRQWLDSNGREYHRIEKVLGVVSQEVTAIVNVGTVLPNV